MSTGPLKNHGLTLEDADRILDPVVEFPEINAVFERVRPITDFRKDDEEARVLFLCRRVKPDGQQLNGDGKDDLYILKCKVQAPSVLAQGLRTPIEGPSDHTKDELKALTAFTESESSSLPHLLGWKTAKQGDDGPMPGGYIAYIVMTLMPGRDLMELKFWSMTEEEREEIRKAFLLVIKQVWKLGFEPYDTALRNILWEPETRQLSIIDFEHWNTTTTDPINMDDLEEMRRWGIMHRPPISTAHGANAREFFRLEALAWKR